MLDLLKHYQSDVLVLGPANTLQIRDPLRRAELLDAHVTDKILERRSIRIWVLEAGEVVECAGPKAIQLPEKENEPRQVKTKNGNYRLVQFEMGSSKVELVVRQF